MLTILKILLTLPIAYGFVYPFISDSQPSGILKEIEMLGIYPAIASAVLFLVLVFCYAKDLVRCLNLISPKSRAAKANSVWWMFALPYNFIEDFFIIYNVSKSIQAEAAHNEKLADVKSFGLVSGLGWCLAQVISLIPNEIGSVAGLIAIVIWIKHWLFIRKINNQLSE